MTKVFYDGNCPICSREIKLYKQLCLDNKVEWYDISNNTNALKLINKSKDECLRSFHVIENDITYKEVNAFFVLWRKIKYFKFASAFFNFFIIKSILNIFYKSYAKYRYRKLYLNKNLDK